MSVPRPYETNPSHLTSSVINQFLYMFKSVLVISSIWYLHCVSIDVQLSYTHAPF